MKIWLCALVAAGGVAGFSIQKPSVRSPGVAWRKVTLDPIFRSEGVAVADVNRDGKTDVLVGDFWYESPAWTRHEIRAPRTDLGDGAHTYSDAFAVFADDVNRDGWPDQIVVGFPGKPAVWYENPKGSAAGRWTERPVAPSVGNETPIFADLFGDGRKRLVFAALENGGQMRWFEPPDRASLDKPWTAHPISVFKAPGTQVFSHGLGAGDVNNDGRPDVLVKEGWWEQPRDAKTRTEPWFFHSADLGEDCADIIVADFNNDGRPDAATSSAHRKGVWWHERQKTGEPAFARRTISDAFSQSHALILADINGDRRPDLVTGKRWWAHGPNGDVEPMAAPVLVWIEARPGAQKGDPPTFAVHQIDDASGVGTQFVVADINNDHRPDIIVSNKRGVFVFEQQAAPKNNPGPQR